MELHAVEAAPLVRHGGVGDGAGRGGRGEAGGSASTRSPWLIQTSSTRIAAASRRSCEMIEQPRARRSRSLRRSRTRARSRGRRGRRAAAPWSACRSRCRAPARRARTPPRARAADRASVTDSGPPERITPRGAKARTSASRDVPGMNLAVDAQLAHAARDQLGVLRAEVEDQDAVRVDVGVRGRPRGGVGPGSWERSPWVGTQDTR